jgi:hypothetical protein
MKKKLLNEVLYKHFKGQEYITIEKAMHTETLNKLILYYAKGSDLLYARPCSMFKETINIKGEEKLRFKPINKGE